MIFLAAAATVWMESPNVDEPPIAMTLHPPIKLTLKEKISTIDWDKWETRARRVNTIGGSILLGAQFYFFTTNGRLK